MAIDISRKLANDTESQRFHQSNQHYWGIIKNQALPVLVKCVNENYLPDFAMEDLDVKFDANRVGATSFGNGKIIFGPFHYGSEYKMFQKDKDLWASPIQIAFSRGTYLEYRAWWLAAHELTHEVVSRVRELCAGIPEPIIPNLSQNLGINLVQGDYPLLKELVTKQAWWKRMGLQKSKTCTVYPKRLYTLNHEDPNKAFKHGVFFQQIYRTLRRHVVNPKFGITVGDYKQKPKPKKYPWSVN